MIDDYLIEGSQVYAKVLIDKKSPFLRSVIINKGSKNDVRLGMVAHHDDFLIGRVVEVNFLTSRILLISDINSRVPVTIQPLNIQAIMIGLDKQKGKLQYIKSEKLINKDVKELIVVTSGAGGVFKSGIPIGKINSTDILENNKIIINFTTDFSQLKYVKISSHTKENMNLDQSNKLVFETSKDKILQINNQVEDIKVLQQQKIIDEEIRGRLEIENTKLRSNLTGTQKKLKKRNEEIKINQIKNNNIKFLELNLLYGHKCKRSLFKPNLFKISTPEYRACVLKNEINKKN